MLIWLGGSIHVKAVHTFTWNICVHNEKISSHFQQGDRQNIIERASVFIAVSDFLMMCECSPFSSKAITEKGIEEKTPQLRSQTEKKQKTDRYCL